MDPNKTLDELLEEARTANMRMDQLRGQMAFAAQWRAEVIAQLRGGGMPVTEIADRLGVTPPAIYKASGDMPVGTATDGRPMNPTKFAEVKGRVADQLSIIRNIVDGKTPEATSKHGWQLLANDLADVLSILESITRVDQ